MLWPNSTFISNYKFKGPEREVTYFIYKADGKRSVLSVVTALSI